MEMQCEVVRLEMPEDLVAFWLMQLQAVNRREANEGRGMPLLALEGALRGAMEEAQRRAAAALRPPGVRSLPLELRVLPMPPQRA